MALVWERQQRIESGQNIYDESVGGVEVSLGNKFPDLIKIEGGFRVKIVAGHLSRLEPGWERGAAVFFTQAGNDLVTGNGLYPAALQVVITSVERLPRLGQLLEVPSHGVLNQLVRAASSFCYPTVYLCLYFGIIEVHVHGPKIRESPTRGNAKEAGRHERDPTAASFQSTVSP